MDLTRGVAGVWEVRRGCAGESFQLSGRVFHRLTNV